MKTPFGFLCLAVLVLASCDKEADPPNANHSSSPAADDGEPKSNDRVAADRPAIATVRSDPPAHTTAPGVLDGQTGSPADRPNVASGPTDGIPGLPQEVADQILAEAARASSPDDRVRIIAEQSDAWRRVDQFRRQENQLPHHRKGELLEALGKKHGDSWQDMATELDVQMAAYNDVMKYRVNGIPGLSEDESFTVIMEALEKDSPDYQRILSIIRESAHEK